MTQNSTPNIKGKMKNLVRHNYSREQYKRQISEIAKSTGARFTRGNVAGQSGFLLKRDDIERERDQLRAKLRGEELA